ncbi:interleukin-1 receptor-associated kinase 4 [Trichonephila clavata]|uniref:non-specific serine/threonine protein kinase n=1 Tax=Trichonephila clavata TaxID=2740835 RepID=A0A8X6JB32_TRICU|nr:interleukin-1 receptor-associated kinase 4 [Trichonephila clavata]
MELKPSTKVRSLGLRERNKLTMVLTINKCWKELAAVLRNPDKEDAYMFSAQDIDILESQQRPAEAFLEHWSTYGRKQPNLGDLLTALKEAHLLRAAHFVQTELLKISDETFEDEEAVTEKLETVLHAVSQNNETMCGINLINEQLQGIDLSDLTLFPFEELSRYTGHFCNLRAEQGGFKIGEGSYGSVYRATISGITVAVKQLKEPIDKQFFTELNILVRCKHENLLSLLGCSIDGPKCCLVYEYMPNGSLQDRLTCIGNSPPLSSLTRLHIAYCSALGLNYLHTFSDIPMVHRDVKSANILLDRNFVPKIGDFGLVRIGGSNTSSTVAITENVIGTSVYMAREAFCGDVSVKLDTFSFGVVLLELLTGLPPYDPKREDRDLITHMESCDDILTMLDQKVIWNVQNAIALHKIAKRCLIPLKKPRPTIFELLPDLHKCCCEPNGIVEWV